MLDLSTVRELIRLARVEDLPQGDPTSELTVAQGTSATATIVAREPLIVCGLELVALIFEEYGVQATISHLVQDGTKVAAEQRLTEIVGDARGLLAAERVVLNFLQRLSGVATYTRAVVDAAGGLTVLDTRKTTPGWRALEKYAVKIGGATNHRGSLSEMILVKNNHIDANAGSVRETLGRVSQGKAPGVKVEVEVRSLAELREALEFRPEMVMLDNMSDSQITVCVAEISAAKIRPIVEVSGGVTGDRLVRLKELGVDCASMGALTTRARWVDISMRIKLSS